MKVGDLVKNSTPKHPEDCYTPEDCFTKENTMIGIVYEKSGIAIKILLADSVLKSSLTHFWENISSYE